MLLISHAHLKQGGFKRTNAQFALTGNLWKRLCCQHSCDTTSV